MVTAGAAATSDESSGYNWWGEGEPGDSDGGESREVGALTPRELTVVRLLAAGRSSKEIAAKLVLSVRTVEWHMRNLHRKLGTTRRRELIAAALRLTLAAEEEEKPP